MVGHFEIIFSHYDKIIITHLYSSNQVLVQWSLTDICQVYKDKQWKIMNEIVYF